MSEDIEKLLKEKVNDLKKEFEGIVKDALKDAQGDVENYAALLAQEYAKYLWRAYSDKDEDARANLGHLKAQVALLAVKRRIIMQRETLDRLRTAIENAMQRGLSILITAAVAAL